jgi:hypothetical protein
MWESHAWRCHAPAAPVGGEPTMRGAGMDLKDDGERAREGEDEAPTPDRGGDADSVERVAWEGAEDIRSRVGEGGEREASQYPTATDPAPGKE